MGCEVVGVWAWSRDLINHATNIFGHTSKAADAAGYGDTIRALESYAVLNAPPNP